jgi:hypothetical protein
MYVLSRAGSSGVGMLPWRYVCKPDSVRPVSLEMPFIHVLRQEPAKAMDISRQNPNFQRTDGFCHFYFNVCTALSKLITLDKNDQCDQRDQSLWISAEESELTNLIVIINVDFPIRPYSFCQK